MKTILLSILAIGCILFLSVCFTDGGCSESGATTDSIRVDASPDSIRLVFVGDVMAHSTQNMGAWHDGGDSCYNYAPALEGMKNYISSADIAVANLEVTFAGEPYTGYPAFSTPQSLAVALRDVGFDMLVTANNHVMDRQTKGMERTVAILDSLGIPNTGAFKDTVARQSNHPLIMEKNGFRLAFLNYTYGSNMGKPKLPATVNYIDTLKMAADLAKARELNADYIITCIHWGEENKIKENETQRRIAAFLAHNGCHLIVGAHPHMVQPIRKIAGADADSSLVAYSLGNFISNQRWRYSDGGIALDVTLVKSDDGVQLHSHTYEPFWVVRFPDRGVQIYRMISQSDYVANPGQYDSMSSENKRKMIEFFDDTKQIVE